jgi:hypothetical protein
LKQLPSAVRAMTLPQAMDLFKYWDDHPPEHEAMAIALRVFTTWGKDPAKPPTPAEIQKSLENRWNAGAMNPKQLFELFGDKPVQMAQAGTTAVH